MTGKVLFAHDSPPVGVSLYFAGDVGLDSLALNELSLRGEIERRGQPQPGAIRERNHGLHRAFAERLDADELGSLQILERARHDFRRAGAPCVHEDRHGNLAAQRPGGGGKAMLLARFAALGVDDQAARFQEYVGYRNSLGEKTARIVPQIQHEGLGPLPLKRGQGVLHLFARFALEGVNPDVCDFIRQHPAFHALDANDPARNRDVNRLLLPFSHHRDLHFAAGLAPKFLDDLLERDALRRFLLDANDLIARLYARFVGRGILDGRHHGEHAVSNRNLYAQTTETTRGFHLHFLEIFRIQIARMGVQRAEHSLDGAANQFLGVHLVDVILLHQAQDLAESPELRIRARFARSQIRNGTHGEPRNEQDQNAHPNQPPGQTIFSQHISILVSAAPKGNFTALLQRKPHRA